MVLASCDFLLLVEVEVKVVLLELQCLNRKKPELNFLQTLKVCQKMIVMSLPRPMEPLTLEWDMNGEHRNASPEFEEGTSEQDPERAFFHMKSPDSPQMTCELQSWTAWTPRYWAALLWPILWYRESAGSDHLNDWWCAFPWYHLFLITSHTLFWGVTECEQEHARRSEQRVTSEPFWTPSRMMSSIWSDHIPVDLVDCMLNDPWHEWTFHLIWMKSEMIYKSCETSQRYLDFDDCKLDWPEGDVKDL